MQVTHLAYEALANGLFKYSAGLRLEGMPKCIATAGTVLYLSGFSISTLSALSSPALPDGFGTYFHSVIEEAEILASQLPPQYPLTGEAAEQVLWRTLIGNTWAQHIIESDELNILHPAPADAWGGWGIPGFPRRLAQDV